MQPYTELIIDGTTLDLPSQGFTVELSYKASDGFTPAGYNSDFSISLPSSKVNTAVFEQWQIAAINNSDSTKFKPCNLLSGGLPILSGRAQLKGTEYGSGVYNAHAKEFKVALYGGNADWILELGELELGELDWSAERHTFDNATVATKFNETAADGYGYHFWKQVDWTYITVPLTILPGRAAGVLQSSPFIFVQSLLNKIFNYLGYTITGNFINSPLCEVLAFPIILPPAYPKAFSVAYTDIAATFTGVKNVSTIVDGFAFDTQTESPTIGANPLTLSVVVGGLGTATRYTAPVTGYYLAEMSFVVDNITAGTVVFEVGLSKVGGAGQTIPYELTAADNGTTLTYSKYFQLTKGENLYTYAGVTSGGGDNLDITAATLKITTDAVQFFSGVPIDFEFLMQDWKCADFLRGLGECFNLQFQTDNANGTVLIEPKDAYVYPVGTLNDGFLTYPTTTGDNQWDLQRGCSDSFEQVENITSFQYDQDDNDRTVQAMEEPSDFKLYEARFNRSINRFKRGEQVLKNSFFAPTLHFFDAEIKPDASGKTPLLPILWGEDWNFDPTMTEKAKGYKPRLLAFMGQRGGADGYMKIFDGTTVSVIEVPAAFAVNYNDEIGTDPCLSYCNQTILGNNVQGLAEKFFNADMARLDSGRTREAYLYLKATDILNLSFQPRIYLDGCWWVLKEIQSYNPMSIDSTRVILQLDQPESDQNILSSPLNGYVTTPLPL